MQRIIVPLDGSERAAHALILAEQIAPVVDGSIELTHVLTTIPMPVGIMPDPVTAKRYLARMAARVPRDILVRTSVLEGNPSDELLALTARTRGSMVVMATHGHSRLKRIALGSVADEIVRRAVVPVVVTRRSIPARADTLRNLLLPLDGSELAEQALPHAIQLARSSDARLHLVRVVDMSTGRFLGFEEVDRADPIERAVLAEQAQDDARSYLDEVAELGRGQGIRVSWEVRIGRPSDEIVRTAETTDVDLIVMSSRGRGGLRRWVLGSVTSAVLRVGSTPILVIPPGAHVSTEIAQAAG